MGIEKKHLKNFIFFSLAVLVLTAGCRKPVAPGTVLPSYTVNFSVEGAGNISARIIGAGSIPPGAKVTEGYTVEFTAKANSGYYIEGWTGQDLKIADNKVKATFKVTKDIDVKVKFVQFPIENLNWGATGTILDTDKNQHNLLLIISDGNVFTFFDGSDGYVSPMTYDGNNEITLKAPGKGTITFNSKPTPLPNDWEITLNGVEVELNGKKLKLSNGKVRVNVTSNNNFIKIN